VEERWLRHAVLGAESMEQYHGNDADRPKWQGKGSSAPDTSPQALLIRGLRVESRGSPFVVPGPVTPAPRNVRQRTRNGSATSSRRVNPCPGRPETPGRKYPPEGSSAPWNNQVSIRTWSWNHSTCRRLGAAAPTWACRWGAQWADTPRLDASANAAALNQTVTPPQRVTSIWRQSTASAANMCPK